MRVYDTEPRDDGFTMPSEFDGHSSTWLLWPERTDIWPFGAKKAQSAFVGLANKIAEFEPVTMGVSSRQYENARTRLTRNVRVVEVSYNGCWIRDTGPTFVTNQAGESRGVCWKFNAWGGLNGGLYFPWDLDNSISQKILEIEHRDMYKPDFVLEGGSITTDGRRTLMVTTECALNPNRNKVSKEEFESVVQRFLGIEKIIWIPRGLAGDETGGHIDNICSFLSPECVALAWTEDRKSPHFERVNEAFEVLAAWRTGSGAPMRIVKVAIPSQITITRDECDSIDRSVSTVPRPEGADLPASYLNFYFVDTALIVPQFGVEEDILAVKILKNALPHLNVVPVNTRELLIGGGNIHCNTVPIY